MNANEKKARACCLAIAGSDCGGNAGLQADLRTFHCHGLHGCTVVAALTAQNPFGVSAIHAVPPDFVAAQLDAVLGVYNIRAAKTGMLPDASVVETVADRLSRRKEIAKVVDPVMVATSGAELSSNSAVAALAKSLLPIATLITPNIPEAEALCGAKAGGGKKDTAYAKDLSKRLYEAFGCAVLVKGGHGEGEEAVDVLCDKNGCEEFSLPWVENPVSTHGTGCSLAAAIAAELALGRDVREAVWNAKRYVRSAIANAFPVGPNCGTLGFAQPGGGRGRWSTPASIPRDSST